MTHSAHVRRAFFLMLGVSGFLTALSIPSNARRASQADSQNRDATVVSDRQESS
jgi:hypothetical protein